MMSMPSLCTTYIGDDEYALSLLVRLMVANSWLVSLLNSWSSPLVANIPDILRLVKQRVFVKKFKTKKKKVKL